MDVLAYILAKKYAREGLATKANLVDGKIPAEELPSYVDDIVEYDSISDFPTTGEEGKIYVAKDTGFTYRWSGSDYIQINARDSVLEFASFSVFPQTGAAETIYVALDTNRLYRWDTASSTYIQVSKSLDVYDVKVSDVVQFVSDDMFYITEDLYNKVISDTYIFKFDMSLFDRRFSGPVTYYPMSNISIDGTKIATYASSSFLFDLTFNYFVIYQDNGHYIAQAISAKYEETSIDDDGQLSINDRDTTSNYNLPKINGVQLKFYSSGFDNSIDINDIEVIPFQDTTALTWEQISKAQNGKLAIYNSGKLYTVSYIGSDIVNFSHYTAGHSIGVSNNVNDTVGITEYVIILTISTGMLANSGPRPVTAIGDYANNYVSEIDTLSVSGKKLIRELNLAKTQGMIADNYNANYTYTVGDYVIYQNSLYKCNTDIPVAEVWTPAHWTLTNLNSEIESKQDKLVSGTNIKTINQQSILGPGNIEIDASHMTMVTYDELVTLVENHELIPGMWYRITDYTTIIKGVINLEIIDKTGYLPYATSEEVPFDIVAMAVDNHTLSENVKAMRPSSGEGIFATGLDNPETWELKYTIENDVEKFPWADSVNGKGVIYYMKDGGNNEAWYDFKNIKFLMYALRRHDTTKNIGASFEYDVDNNDYRYGTLLDAFYTLMGEPIGENIKIDVGEIEGSSVLNLITFIDDISKQALYINMDWTKILAGLSAMMGTEVDLATLASMLGTTESALENMTEITVLRTFFNADFYYTFNIRIPDEDFPSDYNNWDMSIISNRYGYCHDNQLGHCVDVFALAAKEMGMADNITIPAYGLNMMCFQIASKDTSANTEPVWGNKFGSNCYANVFGEAARENYFGEYCWGNRFGKHFHGNKLGHSCNSNSFEDTCSFNSLGNYVAANRFGVNCWDNQFGNNCHLNTLGQSCRGNVFGNLTVDNHLGNHIYYSTFGEGCCNINLTDDGTANDYYDYQQYNVFENGVSYIELKKKTSTSDYLQNVRICQGVYGEISNYIIIEATPNLDYQVEYKKSDSTVVLL